ncbi:MAG: bifunctional transaldolase/phosoglucose isomerase [Terriglobia bacterium]
MGDNPIVELAEYGQSVWYDNIRRSLITSGELKRLIEVDGLRGVTSNPTIFEKAISGSTDYDAALAQVESVRDEEPGRLFEILAVEDIQKTADLFRSHYDRTDHLDGYVSLEVSPLLAHNTATTVSEAHRLWKLVNRPNLMIKVPGTPEGLPAIEALIASGINVNVTLLFSVGEYEKVANAYISGLESRAASGESLEQVASVASFFVSRIDTKVDHLLEDMIRNDSDTKKQLLCQSLLGKIAIANAKMAYQKFREIFTTPRFLALRGKGGRVQRPLWASTGTKNPHYSDILYVSELIGPHTVTTVPPATFLAFHDHGKCHANLEANLEGARMHQTQLGTLGINLNRVTEELLEEGVRLFAQSYESLMHVIEEKRERLQGGKIDRQAFSLGSLQSGVDQAVHELQAKDATRRLWMKDATLWKSEEAHQRVIKNALGWLTIPEQMRDHAEVLVEFASEIKTEGFTHTVLAGMGGSSLCPEVCRTTFGVKEGYPDLHVLDSTHPATISRLESAIDLSRTLFIIASKSGGTTETLSHFKYFWKKVTAEKGEAAGKHFIAITDPGTALETLAKEHSFRRIFSAPVEIGGRYSALSFFGLVPLTLLGVDLKEFLERVLRMVHSCSSSVPVSDNAGALLGATLAVLAKQGRDKLTFVLSPEIRTFGYWVEQLIAESTGKEGKGIVPIEGEVLGEPVLYRSDRVFVHLNLTSSGTDREAAKLAAIESAGHPVIRINIEELIDLGEEFFRWEFATAIAGALLGINAFDQPNVQESKDNTKRVLEQFQHSGHLPEQTVVASSGGLRLFSDRKSADPLVRQVAAHFSQAREGDYIALMAYLDRTEACQELLQRIRMHLRDTLRLATTLGFGPRFLHSTGQLHKGGPNRGLFLQITADDDQDLEIPGEAYTFGILKQAQAIGDMQSLAVHQRRALRVHLGLPVEASLKQLLRVIEDAVPKGHAKRAG